MSIKLSEKVFFRLFRDFLSEYDHLEQAENLFHLIFHEILFLGIDGIYKYQDVLIPHHFQAFFDPLTDNAELIQLRECIFSKVNYNFGFYEKYIVEAADRAHLNYERRRIAFKKGLLEFLKYGKFKQGDLKIPPKQLCLFNDILSELVNEEVTREYYLSIFKSSLIKNLDQILNEFADSYKADILFRMKQLNFNLLDTGAEAIQDHKSFLWPGHLNRLEEFISQEPYSLYITLKKNSNQECSRQKVLKPSLVFTKVEERARIHKEMFEETALMPHCLNRSIIRLIYNVEMRIMQNIPWVTVELLKFNLDNEMRNEIQFLEQYSKAEGPSKADALEATKCFQSRSTDWEFVLRSLEKILSNIQPLNLTKIRCLLKNLDENISIVKNQHVIVFLGNTGAGKSTTIHFLAGSKMMETKIDKIPTIQPISESNDPCLKKVTVSPLPVSETRDIIPIEVKLDSIFHERNKIIFLDTPGFEDTEGPEIDIVNRVKLINVLRAAASVKIVLVHSSKNGERSTGIRKLAKHLEEILPSIEDYGTTLTHFFTKYSSNSEDQEAIIDELKSTHCGSESKEFRDMISTMKRTACHFIEPLKSDLRVGLLRELAKTKNIIKFPEEAFKFGTSSSSLRVFETQILTHQKEIVAALDDATPDYALLKYQLDELKFFDDLLHESRIVHVKYDKCVTELTSKITRICDNITAGFKEKLLKGAMSVDEELEKYKHLQQIERVMKTHLREGFHPTHEIRLHIIKFSQDITEKLSKCSRDEVFSHNFELNALKRISDIFDETKICYHQSCKDLQALIDHSIVALKDLVFTNQFEILASEINQIKRFKNEFRDHAWSKEIKKKFKQSKECLNSALNMPSDLTATIKNGMILSTDDVSKFDQFFAKLDSAMISFKGTHLEEEIAKTYNFWIQTIITNFRHLIEEVQETIKKMSIDHHFDSLESIIKYITSIYKISAIKLQTADVFSGLINSLRDQLTQLKLKIDNEIHHLDPIINSLRCLMSTTWLEELQPLKYPEIICSIAQSMGYRLKSVEQFSLERHENMELFYKGFLKIPSDLPDLKEKLPEVVAIISQAEESFFSHINGEISSIYTKTGLNSSDPDDINFPICIQAINFLDVCSTISVFKDKSRDAKCLLLSEIEMRYVTPKLAELESLHENIISDSTSHQEKSSYVTRFAHVFSRTLDIQKSYPAIFELYAALKKNINAWKLRLLDQFETFSTEMEELLKKMDFPVLKEKILIARSILRDLDQYLTQNKSYQELGRHFQGKIVSEIEYIKTQLEKDLQDFDYRMAADHFELLKSLGLQEVRYENKCKNSLSELKEETRSLIVKIVRFSFDDGYVIRKKLRSIEGFFNFMGKQIKEEFSQEMIFEEFEILLSEKIKQSIIGTNGLFHAHKFAEAEEELSKIIVIKQLLENYLSLEISLQIEHLTKTKTEFITKELVEDFSNVDKLPYVGNDLKQLLIQLHRAQKKTSYNIYYTAYKNLYSKIRSNFKESLCKASQTTQTQQKHLAKLKQVLKVLPSNLKRELSENLQEILQKPEHMENLEGNESLEDKESLEGNESLEDKESLEDNESLEHTEIPKQVSSTHIFEEDIPFHFSTTDDVKQWVVLVGKSGIGKSTIRNSLLDCEPIKSGIEGNGNHSGETFEGVHHIETPDLSDLANRTQAAQEITRALKQGGSYRIFFVIGMRAGRLIPEDIVTMTAVFKAVPKIGSSYGIIINKISKRDFQALDEDSKVKIERELHAVIPKQNHSDYFAYIHEDESIKGDTRTKVLVGLKKFVKRSKFVFLQRKEVQPVSSVDFDEILSGVRYKLRELRLEKEVVKKKLNLKIQQKNACSIF